MKNNKSIKFKWCGINSKGVRITGTITLNNKDEVQKYLRAQQITPLTIRQISINLQLTQNKSLTLQHIAALTTELATLVNAGLSLYDALEIIYNSSENLSMKNLIRQLKLEIEKGASLTTALQKHPKTFDHSYCALINAGEQSGTLSVTLQQLAESLDNTLTIKAKFAKALMYPCVIITISILISLGLLIFVIPQFQSIFDSFGAKLPAPTRAVIYLSQFMQHYWYYAAFFILMFSLGVRYTLHHFARFKLQFHKVSLKIPIIKTLIITASLARWSRTLANATSNGIPIIEALINAANTLNNLFFREQASKLIKQVTKGQYLHTALQADKLFPTKMVQMIAVGENSGSLPKMLQKIADSYQNILDNQLDNLSKLLEPIMMLILAFIIGGLIIAMYLPVFKIGSTI